jgi:UDP-N-acetyl-2-amino-2-deoxyglucuronate dehydrogenase
MKAIKETDNDLVAVFDPHDSIGVIDEYFPRAAFFTEFERFDRHVDKLRRGGNPIDYVSICSPNYLHDAHIRFGLRNNAHVICEKPVVLNPWNLDALCDIEKETDKKIYCILQLRLHNKILALKESIDQSSATKIYDVDLTYLTSRGNWYFSSWKGDVSKSGGVATNLGIHFFDMLIWIFGKVKENKVHMHTHDRAAGYLELEKARIRWFLSTDREAIYHVGHGSVTTHRSMQVDGREIDFSDGFTDLHTKSYQEIINGRGYGISASRQAIEVVHEIRNFQPLGLVGDYHPLAKLPPKPHPFKS